MVVGERLASSSRSRRRTTSRSQVVELVGSLSVHCDGDGGLKGSGRAGVSNEGRSIKASRRTRCRRAGTYRLEGGVRRRRILKGPESVGVGLSKAEESRETMQQLFVSKRKAPKSELSRRRERKKKVTRQRSRAMRDAPHKRVYAHRLGERLRTRTIGERAMLRWTKLDSREEKNQGKSS